jgi:D-galactarolactone cycloisomerase
MTTIASVRSHVLHAPLPPGDQIESGAGRKVARQAVLIEIEDVQGCVGIASASGPYAPAAVQAVATEAAAVLLGEDSRRIAWLWDRLFRGYVSRNAGRAGVGMATLSALDNALWDLHARRLGVPLFDLLGGISHQAGAPAYASSLYWDLTPGEALEAVGQMTQAGFESVKFKIGRDVKADIARLSAVRRVFPDLVILADANQTLDRATARALLGPLEDLSVDWLEEPLPMADLEGHKELRRLRRTCQIASGENIYGLAEASAWIAHGALDVIQTDVTRVGGLTEARRVLSAADAAGVRWCPHTFNDALTATTNLHLVLAHTGTPMFEMDVTANPLMGLPGAPEIADGRAYVPIGVGLGVTPPEVLAAGSDWPWDRIATAIGPGH